MCLNSEILAGHTEKAMAPHSSTLAWKIPWTDEPGRLQSMGSAKSQTWLSDFTFTFHFHALEKEMATHFSVLVWRIPGMAEPGGLSSMESHRVGHDWNDLAAAAVAAGWEGGPRGRGYMCTHNRFTSSYSRNKHSIVKQLYSNLKIF